jgi:hypothetical protein
MYCMRYILDDHKSDELDLNSHHIQNRNYYIKRVQLC